MKIQFALVAVFLWAGCEGSKSETPPAGSSKPAATESSKDTAIKEGAKPVAITPSASTPAKKEEAKPVAAPAPKAGDSQEVTTPSGLKYVDLKVGDGATPKAGQKVVVHYTGWLTNGTKFDSSVDRGQPLDFVLGQGMVIKGWDEGVSTMKVGGKRKLTIPSQLAYRAEGRPPVIPSNATLIFEVELLKIE